MAMAQAEARVGPRVGALGDASEDARRYATVVFLSLNDVYELLPNLDGQGGVAEFKTLLDHTKEQVQYEQPHAKIIVTLNGDFLWRSELDRKDKGPAMMEVMRSLGIEYVVMGNHEFDHSALYLQELLETATFTSFGSNIRENMTDGAIMRRLVDTQLIPLGGGLKLGMFGVCTTETGKDPFAGEEVRFEDEIEHAKRCVETLKAQGADVIVALTHLKMNKDKQLARQVPGMSLILGGHDHEPTTEFVGHTMIHKSGQDALWLGKIELSISKRLSQADGLGTLSVSVDHAWQMLFNRGYAKHHETQAIVERYLDYVEEDYRRMGKLVPFVKSHTALDGTRYTCRRGESNVGCLITDAMRVVLEADVAVINAGLIKGDLLHPPGIDITQRWLEKTLPQPKPTVVIELQAQDLTRALEHMMRRYPTMSSSMPQLSGLRVVYDVSDAASAAGRITSLRFVAEPDQELLSSTRTLRVALPVVTSLDGWQQFFESAPRLCHGPIVRDVVAQYLTRHVTDTIAYGRHDGRLHIVDR